jgi:hypothetical protein
VLDGANRALGPAANGLRVAVVDYEAEAVFRRHARIVTSLGVLYEDAVAAAGGNIAAVHVGAVGANWRERVAFEFASSVLVDAGEARELLDASVLQEKGEWDDAVEPVRSTFVQATVTLSANPNAVLNIIPELREMSRKPLGLKLELGEQPTLRRGRPSFKGNECPRSERIPICREVIFSGVVCLSLRVVHRVRGG